MDKINVNAVIAGANERASAITKSVLVLARIAKVTPKQLAEALQDENANARYTAKFTSEYVEAAVEAVTVEEN